MTLTPFELALLRDLDHYVPRAFGAANDAAHERLRRYGLIDLQFRLTAAGRIAAELAEALALAEAALRPDMHARAFTED
jgi:hypothetical protein